MEEKRKSGFATAGLVLGIIGLCTSFIPIINNLSFILVLIGGIFAIISLIKKASKGMAIAGLIICIIAGAIVLQSQQALSNELNNVLETSLTPDTTSEQQSNTNTNTNENKTYNVGDVYKDNTLAIKYVSLNDNFTGYSKYAEVKNGYKVIKAEFEFENLSSSDQYVSSYEFDCYADGYDCESFYSVDNSSFSSTLSSGKKTKGSVYFEVPVDAEKIDIEYTLNSWTSSKVEFVVK